MGTGGGGRSGLVVQSKQRRAAKGYGMGRARYRVNAAVWPLPHAAMLSSQSGADVVSCHGILSTGVLYHGRALNLPAYLPPGWIGAA